MNLILIPFLFLILLFLAFAVLLIAPCILSSRISSREREQERVFNPYDAPIVVKAKGVKP